MQVDVSLALPHDAASVPLARHVVAGALLAAGVTPDCVDEVEVAISEACTNVVVHAGSAGRYDVRINISDEQVNMDVVDTGVGFSSHPVAGEELVEGGRGFSLMTALTDRAIFDSVTGGGGGGSVHLSKRLRWKDDAPLHDRRARTHAQIGQDGGPGTSARRAAP
jgi:serine/threonine-protein kinase RsbW